MFCRNLETLISLSRIAATARMQLFLRKTAEANLESDATETFTMWWWRQILSETNDTGTFSSSGMKGCDKEELKAETGTTWTWSNDVDIRVRAFQRWFQRLFEQFILLVLLLLWKFGNKKVKIKFKKLKVRTIVVLLLLYLGDTVGASLCRYESDISVKQSITDKIVL